MITVWRVELDDPTYQRPERLAQLDAAERARADRFHFLRDARRWQASRVALREVLAAELDAQPENSPSNSSAAALRFALEAKGKPRLAMPNAVAFNLSHAGGLALIAVGGSLPLGVDVEEQKPVPEMEGVAETHFADDERRALFALPEAEQLAAFYRIWTRKEAYVKATGIGIGPMLARFSVSLDAERAELLRDETAADAAARWTMQDLPLPAPYVGALVLRSPPPQVQIRVWG